MGAEVRGAWCQQWVWPGLGMHVRCGPAGQLGSQQLGQQGAAEPAGAPLTSPQLLLVEMLMQAPLHIFWPASRGWVRGGR